MLSEPVRVMYSTIVRAWFERGVQSKTAGSDMSWTRMAERSTPPLLAAWAWPMGLKLLTPSTLSAKA